MRCIKLIEEFHLFSAKRSHGSTDILMKIDFNWLQKKKKSCKKTFAVQRGIIAVSYLDNSNDSKFFL